MQSSGGGGGYEGYGEEERRQKRGRESDTPPSAGPSSGDRTTSIAAPSSSSSGRPHAAGLELLAAVAASQDPRQAAALAAPGESAPQGFPARGNAGRAIFSPPDLDRISSLTGPGQTQSTSTARADSQYNPYYQAEPYAPAAAPPLAFTGGMVAESIAEGSDPVTATTTTALVRGGSTSPRAVRGRGRGSRRSGTGQPRRSSRSSSTSSRASGTRGGQSPILARPPPAPTSPIQARPPPTPTPWYAQHANAPADEQIFTATAEASSSPPMRGGPQSGFSAGALVGTSRIPAAWRDDAPGDQNQQQGQQGTGYFGAVQGQGYGQDYGGGGGQREEGQGDGGGGAGGERDSHVDQWRRTG